MTTLGFPLERAYARVKDSGAPGEPRFWACWGGLHRYRSAEADEKFQKLGLTKFRSAQQKKRPSLKPPNPISKPQWDHPRYIIENSVI